MKKYINNLDEFPVIAPGNENINAIKVGSNAVLYHVDKLVYDKKENVNDKLTTVFSSLLSDENNGLIMLIKGSADHVDFYIGNVTRNINEKGDAPAKTIENAGKTLTGVLKGNFPGTELHRLNAESHDQNGKFVGDSVESVIEACFKDVDTIASVSGIAALRNQNENKSEVFVQGMEKLVDSMRGKEYSVLYIADVMSNDTIEAMCAEYEDIYSQLSPFKQSVTTLNKNTSDTETKGFVKGVVDTTNESLAKSVTHGKSHTITKTNTIGGGVHAGIKIKEVYDIGANVNYNHAKGTADGTNEAEGTTTTKGKAKSLTEQNSIANAITNGTGESLQITYDNRAVRTLLERIDEQIKRLRSCEDFGLFDSCVYFISNKYENAVSAASAYKSIIRGENSSVESAAINVWTGSSTEGIKNLTDYLERFYHPLFAMDISGNAGLKAKDHGKNFLPVSPALMVSGHELAYQFSFPKKALSGLPVIECAEFGRNVMAVDGDYTGDVKIGHIYHMHQKEESEVKLSRKDLTAHTFVTGSTGAGKSNAIYQMLTELTKSKDTNFMVVEPAKGEYKDVFGTLGSNAADVYGTNPRYTPLLRINPFRFPETTHIYEHMDRLVEIFNVCWPMYAAMPAVLKAAIEKSYIAMGWNLEESVNRTGVNIYPTFATVAQEVRKYIDSSEYSDENKGNYKGSLLTRLESLTNGINGMVFTSDDIKDEDLFDRNVIVDLSRVGSTETKALIMGILVMKLQEYRAGTSKKNSPLKHVTVLEEAHNLLKRTSTEQSMEGSNLLGKSVEMLANSIAEMRTYGEAFIIADQAPGLLDMSVIRNTNTKIILRLPELSDRQLVGKAAGLSDEQIEELSRLKTGVAAVYQNNWISPVLCQFERYEDNGKEYIHPDSHKKSNLATKEVLDIIMKSDIRKKLDDVDYEKKVIDDITISDIPDFLKVKLLDYLVAREDRHKAKQVAEVAYQFFDAEPLLNNVKNAADFEEWRKTLIDKLQPSVKAYDENDITTLLALLVHEHYLTHKEYEPIYLSCMEYINNNWHLV
jgi:DNA helicase HerA-like ATPase